MGDMNGSRDASSQSSDKGVISRCSFPVLHPVCKVQHIYYDESCGISQEEKAPVGAGKFLKFSYEGKAAGSEGEGIWCLEAEPELTVDS